MTQTMLERAAVALMNRQRNRYGLCSINVGMFDVEEIERAKDLVRAVLMAVREPTRGQAESAGVPLKQFGSWGYDPIHDRQREFTAMIDAILNEPQP